VVVAQHFEDVLFQEVPPEPSWTAFKKWKIGALTVEVDHARFVPRSGDHVVIDRVSRVSKGWKDSLHGKPLMRRVDTWLEIVYGDAAEPRVAYLNDGRFGRLGIYLPHEKLLAAMRSLTNMG
jgi:hypothetical protein